MSIAVFVLTLLPLFAAPIFTHRIFMQAFDWQSRQIAVDNGGILVGREQRRALRALNEANQRLRELDSKHHPVHFCARARAPGPHCPALDLVLEHAIEVLHWQSYRAAAAIWRNGRRIAEKELAKWNVEGRIVMGEIPVVSRKCPICHREVNWEPQVGKEISEVWVQGDPRLGVRVRWIAPRLGLGGKPDYQLELVPP